MRRDWTKEELNAASEMMKQSGHVAATGPRMSESHF